MQELAQAPWLQGGENGQMSREDYIKLVKSQEQLDRADFEPKKLTRADMGTQY